MSQFQGPNFTPEQRGERVNIQRLPHQALASTTDKCSEQNLQWLIDEVKFDLKRQVSLGSGPIALGNTWQRAVECAPAIAAKFPEAKAAKSSLEDTLNFIKLLSEHLLLAHDRLLVGNVYGPEQIEFLEAEIDRSSWHIAAEALGQPIFEAACHFHQAPAGKVAWSFQNLIFLDHARIREDAMLPFGVIAAGQILPAETNIGSLHHVLQEAGINDFESYLENFSFLRFRKEKIALATNQLYLRQLTGAEIEYYGDHSELLLRSGSPLHRAIELNRECLASQQLIRGTALHLLSQEEGLLGEMAQHLKAGRRGLAQAALIEFTLWQLSAADSPLLNSMEFLALDLFKHRLGEMQLQNTQAVLDYTSRGPDSPDDRAFTLLHQIYARDFLTSEEKLEQLARQRANRQS